MAAYCERCKKQPVTKDNRFCNKCQTAVLAGLRAVGYLETGGYGRKRQGRTSEQKELTHETKHGTGTDSGE